MRVKMTEEDEPPSYEEATGLKKMLPQNIGRQITRALSQQDEEEGTTDDNNTAADRCLDKLCSKRSCIRMLFASLLLGLGILLTIMGSHNLTICHHSMLPTFLLVTGCCIVGAYALCILLFCIMLSASRDTIASLAGCLVCLWSVFFVVWWIAGCYWTWSWGSAGCVQSVYGLALAITILPPIILTLVICKACKSL